MRDNQPQINPNLRSRVSKSVNTARWDEAFLRVESYLRAYGLESRVRLNQITSEIIQDARSRRHEDEDAAPVSLAMQIAQERVEQWLNKIELATALTRENSSADARVALILADLPGRWSDCFLSVGSLPDAFTALLAENRGLQTPELRVSPMPPATLEFGSDPSEPGLVGWRTSLSSRAALLWIFVLGLFSAAWAASH